MPAGRNIKKTMDRADLKSVEAQRIIGELNELVAGLQRDELRASSWYGTFGLSGDPDSLERINRGYGYEAITEPAVDRDFPWFLYWEIVWVTLNAEFRPGQRVLDLGGSSSLFSYYLASKGLDVTAVDLQGHLVANGDEVARRTGWRLTNHRRDIRTMEFGERFVAPSGLQVRGNERLHDNGISYLLHPFYHPGTPWQYRLTNIRNGHFGRLEILRRKRANDYTFAALFQEKGP